MKEPSHKDMAKACNLNHKTVANYMKRIHYEEFGFPLGISNGKVYKPPQGAVHAALDLCTVKNDQQQKPQFHASFTTTYAYISPDIVV